jgi:FMN-binding domain
MRRVINTAKEKFVRRQTVKALLGLGVVSASNMAHSIVYMTEEKASQMLLPQADKFQAIELNLSEAMQKQIAQLSQTRVPQAYSPRCVVATGKAERVGWVLFDKVIGKYDLIDYAVGFNSEFVCTGLEILVYRESHGGEVRQGGWRYQFVGKKNPNMMKVGDDIRNISGATLSCVHLTEGAQRLAALVAMLK